MKVKVCGMNFPENVADVSKLPIDFMGFIFYSKSPRYLNMERASAVCGAVNGHTKKVGVFVNEPVDNLQKIADQLNLDFVQLHGRESLEYVMEVSRRGIPVIKVFSIDDAFDWEVIPAYTPYCSLFLFDTATQGYGGSGRKFAWSNLKEYKGTIPFLLSGGIGIQDVDAIKSLSHPMLYGIDLNSKMEISPGLKDHKLITNMLKELAS
jgi:phosphoribosylanthranilate isomerase